MKKVINASLLILCFSAFLIGCSESTPHVDPEVEIESKKREFVENYTEIVLASYEDSMSKLNDLKVAVDNFVDNPDAAGFQAAKDAWLASREPYGQTEAYRFYDGPIDGADGEPEGYINAWPLDEALIDYVESGTGGEDLSDDRQNIVNNPTMYPVITVDALREIAGYSDNESNVTVGFHAIEFLLWGQDNTDPTELKPGQRSFTDYTTKENATRRGQYLRVVTDLLIEDLESVVDQWKSGATYRTEFLSLPVDEAITKILTGAAKLSKGELAGERMFTAVEFQNQEDEHSCFADNTHRDIYLNAQSINNIINGSYTKTDGSLISGTSLLDVLALVNSTEADELNTKATEVMVKVKVISDNAYFDNQIIGETIDNFNNPIMSSVLSLRQQGDQLAQAGKSITGNTIDPSV
jgi:putative iron-regulated protein